MAKRILLVTNIFPPHIGGPATFIDRIARVLSDQGYRVTVVCSSDAPREASDAQRPFQVVRVCLRLREWYEIKVRLVLAWQLLIHRRVLVNGLEPYVAMIAPWVGARYLVKIVGDTAWETARNRGSTTLDIDRFQTDPAAQRAHAGLVQTRNRVFARALHVFTPSAYLKGMVAGWGVAAERITVVANGTDLVERRTDPPAGAPFTVLFVGRLTNWKGVETLLIALQTLPGVRAEILGDGPELPNMVELAPQLGVAGQVEFRGRADQAQVKSAMRACTCLVLTSLYEGLSHTLLEAMALGVPVVASRCGGNPAVVVDGVNGLLVPPQDPPALAAALARLRDDPALLQRLADGAYATGRELPIERTAEAVVELVKRHLG